jgi:hypothetical protein
VVDAHVTELRASARSLEEHAGALAAARPGPVLPGSSERAPARGLEGDAAEAVGRLVARYRRVLPAFTALAQASLRAAEALDAHG